MLRSIVPARSPFRTRATARLRFRPALGSLEDRCLMAVALSGSNPGLPLVGSPVTWTATSSDHGASPVYQFRVELAGEPSEIVRDFNPSASFLWSPLREGTYTVAASVKDGFTSSAVETASFTYTVGSRVVGSVAVVSPTANPLVALYSAPTSSGASLRVEFAPVDALSSWVSTTEVPIVAGESTNVYVAGMRPETTYQVRHVLNDGTASSPQVFRTGALPANLTFPTFEVAQPPSEGTGLGENVVFHVGVNGPPGTVDTVATDLAGNVVWYYDPVANAFPSFAPSLIPGGTVLLLGLKQDNEAGTTAMREVDLAGNILRETNISAVNAQLAARGSRQIKNFHHDAQRLPDGGTAVLAKTSKFVRLNGVRRRYEGDMVIVLDANFQVRWVWDPFTRLNVRRLPTLGENTRRWTHSNSVAWSPVDGNLIVSMRSQDWVIKINYDRGGGDGRVLWRLGQGGDFRLKARVRSPWFSHQHDARYVDDSTIVLFDNSNVRQSRSPRAKSRGQAFRLDETNRVAKLVGNVNLGAYAPFTGSAQRLRNGNFLLDSPLLGETVELLPSSRRTYTQTMKTAGIQYRTYLFANLYGDPA